jgi:hypothetical protein
MAAAERFGKKGRIHHTRPGMQTGHCRSYHSHMLYFCFMLLLLH